MTVYTLFHSVTAPGRVIRLLLPLSGHRQVLTIYPHHQVLRSETLSIHLHLESWFLTVIALRCSQIILEQPHW